MPIKKEQCRDCGKPLCSEVTQMNYDEYLVCPKCNHNLEEYADKDEWVVCPFCGF